MTYVLFNIGCIECGVSSKIVGVFECKEDAEKMGSALHETHGWRGGGQNNYEVYELPSVGFIDGEYLTDL